jgi:hypothetical protein
MEKLFILTTLLVVLVGCGVGNESAVTVTEVENVPSVTVTLAPTEESTIPRPPTSEPTTTPEPLDEFEECMKATSGVRYVVTGEGVDVVRLWWEDDTPKSQVGDFDLPVCLTYTGFEQGDQLNLSARVISPKDGEISIKCLIYDGESILSEEDHLDVSLTVYCFGRAK